MKVLFIGGTGTISQAVSALAVQKGWEVSLLNRGQRPANAPTGARLIQADIRDVTSARAALENERFDVVADFISFTPEHLESNIKLFEGKIGQYIFISSASAYQKPPVDYIITESTPLVNPFWEYSRQKAACEDYLMARHRATGFPFTVVRPSLTYSDQRLMLTFIPKEPYALINRIKTGKPLIVQGDGTSLWVITHNTDFAKGFVGLMGNPMALGNAFHITTDEVLTWDQIHCQLYEALGEKPNLVHISSDYLIKCDPSLEGPLLGDKSYSVVFDNSKLKRTVPTFQATVPFREGARRFVQYYEDHPEPRKLDPAWDAQMDRLIEMYNK